jgi:hypothetical protein
MSGTHQLDHLREREATRDHQRLGRAIVRRGGEQFERAATVDGGGAGAWSSGGSAWSVP